MSQSVVPQVRTDIERCRSAQGILGRVQDLSHRHPRRGSAVTVVSKGNSDFMSLAGPSEMALPSGQERQIRPIPATDSAKPPDFPTMATAGGGRVYAAERSGMVGGVPP